MPRPTFAAKAFTAVLVALALLGSVIWFIAAQGRAAHLEELRGPGLLAVGVPDLEWSIDEVSVLEDNRGLVTTYRYADGEPVSQFRLLNLRAGSGDDLCELLIAVEPTLAERCEVSGLELSAAVMGPSTFLHAEGQLRAATLVVLVGHPATLSDEHLRALVDNAELMTVEGMLEEAG